MKRQLSIIMAASALLFGVTSCNNGDAVDETKGEGTIQIALDFDKIITPAGTKADKSTAKPTTGWGANIKDLTLILTGENPTDDQVIILRDIKLPPPGATDYEPEALIGIPGGKYRVTVIANMKATSNPHVAAPTAKINSLKVGDKLNQKFYELMKVTPAQSTPPAGDEPAGYDNYGEPAEIFIAKSADVVEISDGGTNTDLVTKPLKLQRAVSLLRIRINKKSEYAKDVNFDEGKGIRLRRMSSALNYFTQKGIAIGDPISNMYSNKAFKTANPTVGYTPNDMGLSVNDFSLWNDYIIIPGGGGDTKTGFNLVITGKVPQGYIGSNGNAAPAGGAIVMWQATILSPIPANNILEANVTINNPGRFVTPDDPMPPIEKYGTMKVKISLAEWGIITSVPVPM